MPSADSRRLLIAGVSIAAAYMVAARLGFLAAFAAEQITTVWAPTGIGLAALLHWGRRLWPAIWIGAFAANAATDAPLWTAACIASGNTLEALVAASLLGRAHGFDPALRRVADTLRFMVVGAMLAPIVSATIGVTTLSVAGVQPWARFSGLWSEWWLGDALGALVVAPIILTTARSSATRSRQEWLASAVLILIAVIVTEVVFGQFLSLLLGRGPLHYVIFPFVVVAAVRFGQPVAALLVLATSAVTIWNTVRGSGPFAAGDVYQGLVLLQIFMGVLASTELLLAAAMAEQQTSQRAMLDEQRERERTDETLRASEERLRDADRRKDEFLAMLAHELRNPLAPIRTGLELVRLAGDSREILEQVRPMMERQVGHMVRLIDDLLDVSRITSGKIHLQRAPAILEDLINGAVEANRVAIDAAGLRLTVQLADPRIVIWVDPTRFVQVVSNLLHNATKFTDSGGQIVIRGELVQDDVRGRELVLSVSDTGIGISAGTLPRVFELFTQGERSPRRPQPGLGVGLALARRIVEMHGGRIEARSDGRGCGSEFTIHMPILREAEGATAGETIALMRHPVKRRVLVVDDNADAAETLAALVHALGGESRTAIDGATAIQCAMEFSPDVILLDIGMDNMDGYETCRRIRQLAVGPRVFIIAITGWGQDADKVRAAEAGFDAHLTKPADPAVLERLLAEATRATV